MKDAIKIIKEEAKKKVRDPGDRNFFMGGFLKKTDDKKEIGSLFLISLTYIFKEKMKKYFA